VIGKANDTKNVIAQLPLDEPGFLK